MSCKILAGDATACEPMEWTRAPVEVQEHPATLYLKEARPDPNPQETLENRIREVELNAEQRVREAHARGRQEGEAAAIQQYQTKVEQMAAILQATAGLRARFRRESEVDLVKLSIAIARRILRRELSVDPGALGGIVKACLEKLESQQVQQIRLHPLVAEALRLKLDPGVPVIPDTNLAPGDVRIETDQGEVDAGLETQLGEIERGFADLLPQRRIS